MLTSKNPCYAQAIWDWILSQKNKKQKKNKTKQKQKQTNKELRGLHEPSLQLQKDFG